MTIKHVPPYYTSSIQNLDVEFIHKLDALIATFPYAQTYPDISSYSATLSKQQGELDKIRSDIFILKDNIHQDIETVYNSIQTLITRVEEIDIDNNAMLDTTDTLNDKTEGSYGMIQDTRELYNFNLLENWLMFFSICGLGYAVMKK